MDEIINAIRQSEKVSVMAHISEDPDAIGSVFAMADVLEQMGKRAVCVLSGDIGGNLEFIHRDYVVYEQGMEIESDLCICLDLGELKRLGKRLDVFEKAKVTVNIDHHYTNDNFADFNWVDGEAAATGEMLFKLFSSMGSISTYCARCLYAAIAADTGCFKYSNASPETLRIAAALMEHDINHAEIARILFDTEPIEAVMMKGEIMSRIESYYGGKLRIAAVLPELFDKYNVEEKDVSGFVDIPRRIAGTEAAVSIRKKGDDKVKISFRSNGTVNVAEIASMVGGGGHKMAAGAAMDTTIDEAKEKIVSLFADVFEDN